MSMDEYGKKEDIYCSECHELISYEDDAFYDDEGRAHCEKCKRLIPKPYPDEED